MSRTTLFNKNHITITKDTYKPINVNRSNDYELKTVSKKELKKRRIDPYQYIM